LFNLLPFKLTLIYQSMQMGSAMQKISVRIPCSTSNLGSGFDTLGLALALYNEVQVKQLAAPCVVIEQAPAGADHELLLGMLSETADLFFQTANQTPFGASVQLGGQVPSGRGLGASATARLGLAAGLNHLAGSPLTREGLLDLITALEHHPDNASPCLLGGFTVSGMVDGKVRCLSFPVSAEVKFVTLIPNFEIATGEARKLVPTTYSKADTVHSLNRAALISAAFASGNYEALRGVFDDRVHQPYREKLIPQLSRVIREGVAAGAIGGWLSGSGSAIMCMTLQTEVEAISAAMHAELPESHMLVLTADNRGMEIVEK
jgi:homoserine kinase